uniref:Uncharacterized protein n=1 Tax=viral metagenome TaxID=1070528 RepID=A0A6M3X553_9ZZZZ
MKLIADKISQAVFKIRWDMSHVASPFPALIPTLIDKMNRGGGFIKVIQDTVKAKINEGRTYYYTR